MLKILITGGAGHIGGSLAQRLVQNENNFVVIADNLLTGSETHLPSKNLPNWKFIKCDVNNKDHVATLFASEVFDYVFHYAAVVGVERTLAFPTMVLADIDGLKNIFEFSKDTHVKRIFFASSSEVYGEPLETPQKEDTTPVNAKFPYAIVKSLGETYCRVYKEQFDLNYTIFRFFNTYGPLQSKDFVIPNFIEKALRNEDIIIHGDGSQTRTFCYINDNLDVIEKILKEDQFVNSTLNIGSDIPVTITELAEKIITITNSQPRIVYTKPRYESEISNRKPDITRMKEVLGRDITSLDQGLQRIIDFKKSLPQI